jgi:alkanesulfonate monooxygenase SsuD/methylene tetrahydromethanopterin reductase-like flavin-dependent oxidoreductase (luciferase family)
MPTCPGDRVATEGAMVEVSVVVEALFGLDWPTWKRLVPAIEDLGFVGIYVGDQFLLNDPPDCPALELIVALTYLADHTEQVRFGPMVAPISFRDPVMLARQAAALDALSGGRMILGVGAGWLAREHAMFGYALGDVPTRSARLEEGLEVITRLLRSDAPVSYDGRFFRLHEAVLPGPRRPGGPPVMVGGSGPKRTLPLVARFADVWNAQLVSPSQLRERIALLDELVQAAGRRPSDIRRTLSIPVLCGRTPAELEDRVRGWRRYATFADLPLDRILDWCRQWPAIVGTPEEVIVQLRAYAEAGIAEIAVHWFGVDDLEGLEVLANEILPYLGPATAQPTATG